MEFQEWFNELLQVSRENGEPELVKRNDPNSYLEYFLDGDTPLQAYRDLVSHPY